jgi:hypothetical protein
MLLLWQEALGMVARAGPAGQAVLYHLYLFYSIIIIIPIEIVLFNFVVLF